MIYVFCGEDTDRKNTSYEKFLKTLPEEVPVFFVNKNDFDPTQLESFYSGASLFSAQSAVVLRDLLGEEEISEFILNKLKFLSESQNTFVFTEGKLKKPILDAFKKARAELNVFEKKDDDKVVKKFDNFQIANAFANRDKFHTWLYFRQAVERGVELEPLAGILFWKIKDMLLRRNFSKFKEAELKNFAAHISYLLPNARKQGPEAESAFEQFLLEAF